MRLPFKGPLLAVLAVLPFFAQDTQSVTVEEVQLNKQTDVVSFDVRNLTPQAIHAWTATITLTKREQNLPDLDTTEQWSSDLCSPSKADQFPPKDALHCLVNMASGDPKAAPIKAEVKITAVLFEDGTTEGSVDALNQASASRRALLLTSEYWLTSFHNARSTGSALQQLQTFGKLLATADSAAPSGLALRSDVYPHWTSMRQSVAAALGRIENGSDAASEVASLQKRLESLQRTSKKASEAFPWRDSLADGNLQAAQPGNRIETLLPGLKILKIEQHGNTAAAYVRNDYSAEIAGYAIGAGDGSPNISTLSGGAAVAPGETFQIDFPTPRLPDEPALEILCVVFRDRTGEGDPMKIRELNEHWAGRLSARAAFTGELHALPELPPSEISAAIEKLCGELQDEPHVMPGANQSQQFVEGFTLERRWVRGMLLADLHQLRHQANGEARVKQAVTGFVAKLDRQ